MADADAPPPGANGTPTPDSGLVVDDLPGYSHPAVALAAAVATADDGDSSPTSEDTADPGPETSEASALASVALERKVLSDRKPDESFLTESEARGADFENNAGFSGHIRAGPFSFDWPSIWEQTLDFATFAVLVGASYGALVALLEDDVLPGSKFFPVFLIWVTATVFAKIAGALTLPPLVGMLLSGLVLRQIPGLIDSLDSHWSEIIRSTGLTVILMRSGLELDLAVFRKLGWATLRLTVLPGVSEAVLVAISSKFILDLTWPFAFVLGFIVGAVSPAVVVIGMFDLQRRGYGIDKGIPSMVVAASSFDDVVAITGYSIASGLAFGEGSVAWSAIQGPLNVVVGVFGGILAGVLLWVTKVWNNSLKRIFAFLALGSVVTYGLGSVGFHGGAAMWNLVMGITAAYGWKSNPIPALSIGASSEFAVEVEHFLGLVWRLVLQPMLFGLIGSAMDFNRLNSGTIPKAIGIVFIGLSVRLPVAFLSVTGTGLNFKEKAFVALAWIAKATVQAALGSAPLDFAEGLSEDDPDREKFLNFGLDILSVAVFAILLTAPTGLVLIQRLGPRWMNYTDPVTREEIGPKLSGESQVMTEMVYRRELVRQSVEAFHEPEAPDSGVERRRLFNERSSIEGTGPSQRTSRRFSSALDDAS